MCTSCTVFAETLMVICSGELRQQLSDLPTRMRRDDYYARIYSKTASLFELATEATGILENAPEEPGGRIARVWSESWNGVPGGRRCIGFHRR